MNFETLRKYKSQIIDLAKNYGVNNIRVFGSVLTGTETAESDIDFLVSATPGTTLMKLAGLQNRLQELLHCRVDIVTDGKKFNNEPEFQKNIVENAEAL